jgi:hypothetical protein
MEKPWPRGNAAIPLRCGEEQSGSEVSINITWNSFVRRMDEQEEQG